VLLGAAVPAGITALPRSVVGDRIVCVEELFASDDRLDELWDVSRNVDKIVLLELLESPVLGKVLPGISR
jgi:hypothetical protein